MSIQLPAKCKCSIAQKFFAPVLAFVDFSDEIDSFSGLFYTMFFEGKILIYLTLQEKDKNGVRGQ